MKKGAFIVFEVDLRHIIRTIRRKGICGIGRRLRFPFLLYRRAGRCGDQRVSGTGESGCQQFRFSVSAGTGNRKSVAGGSEKRKGRILICP